MLPVTRAVQHPEEMKMDVRIWTVACVIVTVFLCCPGCGQQQDIAELQKKIEDLEQKQADSALEIARLISELKGRMEVLEVNQKMLSAELAEWQDIMKDLTEPAPAEPETVERAVGLNRGGKYEQDARELAASNALGQARYFDAANPYEDKEIVAAKYREVVDKYPDTAAAKEAAKMFEEVMQRRQ
jgi:hypothetical protein